MSIDIEKLAEENGFVTHTADDGECYADLETLKQFAEAYHRAKCEQGEPVAWKYRYAKDGNWQASLSNFSDEDLSWLKSTYKDFKVIPLYTSPQPKEWVSLHDDDINELSDQAYKNGGWDIEFARYIEAKLKELNT